MSYLVLARKYRPQSFDDLVGQEHVAKTLANAIAQGRVAHAFLFTGVRGVGKTTSARLLAKCLNCLGEDGNAKGPTSSPCQKCAACTEIAAGADIDVQEIDGASYNGVDEVRRLQEGLVFRPARDRFKIYIVDEVHMLSNAAWNAFLKTLEEPPPHVKFIFATTEVHKVPVTILSRCQRYDFKLIGTQVIARRLREVLEKESIAADDAAVAVLAREAAGSMRDAMSLLDQVIAFAGERLTAEDVARVLGVADRKVLHDLVAAVVSGDPAGALRAIDGVAQQGFDIPHVARDLLRHLRDLVVIKVSGEAGRDMLDLADEEVGDVVRLAETAEIDDVTRIYQGFSRGFDDIARSGQPRAALEMLLVRLARRPPLLPLDELLARLGDLERRLTGGAPPPGGGGGARGAGRSSGGASSGRPAGAASSSYGGSGPTSRAVEGALALAAPIATTGATTGTVVALASNRAADVAPRSMTTPLVAPAAPPVPAPPPASAVRVARVPSACDVPESLATWRSILDRVRAVRPGLAAVLEHAAVPELTKERVILAYDGRSFLGTQVSDAESLEVLTREVRAHFDAPTEVALDLSPRSLDGFTTVAALDEAAREAAQARARAAVVGHPLVRALVDLFGAELRDVRIPEGD